MPAPCATPSGDELGRLPLGSTLGHYYVCRKLQGRQWPTPFSTHYYLGQAAVGGSGAALPQVIVKVFNELDEESRMRHEKELGTLRRLVGLPMEARVVRLSPEVRDQDYARPTVTSVGPCRFLAMTPAWETDLEDQLSEAAAGQRSYDLGTALRWGIQVAETLRLIHIKTGACHGEVNPRNVVLAGPRGDAFLTGVAVTPPPEEEGVLGGDRGWLSYSAFVAPELQEGLCKRFEPASEVWSWGVLFYCILARSLESQAGADPTAYFESLTGTPSAASPRNLGGFMAPLTSASSSGWVDNLRKVWAPVEVPQDAIDVIKGAVRRESVERMCLQTIIRRLRRAMRLSSSARTVEDYSLGEGAEPSSSGVAGGEDWQEVVCQCDDRLFAQREAAQPDWKNVGEDLVRKGWAHQKMRQYNDAELCYRGAVNSFRRAESNVDYNGIATALNNLASVHLEKGEEDKALLLQEAVLRIRRNVLPADHPAIASFLTNLASLYELRKEYDKAVPLYEEAADILKMVLPAEHPDIATAVNNIAVVHQTRGDYEQALRLHEEALAIRRKSLSKDHPLVAASLTSIAMVHYCRGDRHAALPVLEEALEIQRRATMMGAGQPSADQGMPGLALSDLEAIFDLIQSEINAEAVGMHHPAGMHPPGPPGSAPPDQQLEGEEEGEEDEQEEEEPAMPTVPKKRRGRPPSKGKGRRSSVRRAAARHHDEDEEPNEEEEEDEDEEEQQPNDDADDEADGMMDAAQLMMMPPTPVGMEASGYGVGRRTSKRLREPLG